MSASVNDFADEGAPEAANIEEQLEAIASLHEAPRERISPESDAAILKLQVSVLRLCSSCLGACEHVCLECGGVRLCACVRMFMCVHTSGCPLLGKAVTVN